MGVNVCLDLAVDKILLKKQKNFSRNGLLLGWRWSLGTYVTSKEGLSYLCLFILAFRLSFREKILNVKNNMLKINILLFLRTGAIDNSSLHHFACFITIWSKNVWSNIKSCVLDFVLRLLHHLSKHLTSLGFSILCLKQAGLEKMICYSPIKLHLRLRYS